MQDIILGLVRHEVLAKEITPESQDARSWVALYPFFDPNVDNVTRTCKVRIKVVEIPISELTKYENSLDGDESFIVEKLNIVVSSPDQVALILATNNIECDGFTPPSFANYPL